MADPITWGLLNLIKKRVKGVQTTLDGVSDKVSGLPDSLDADFTEVKEAISELKSDNETINNKLNALQINITEVMGNTSTIISICNDILLGRQISEWIADLAASGEESVTYSDPERMNALIENADAARNSTVCQYLFNWSVTNSKVGIYLNSAIGSTSGVSWSSMTSPSQACSNSKSFNKIANDQIVFNCFMHNSTAKQSIFANCSTTESIIIASSISMSTLDGLSTTEYFGKKTGSGYNTDLDKDMFILEANAHYGEWTMNYQCGGSEAMPDGSFSQLFPVNKFVTSLIGKDDGSATVRSNIKYIDFS